MAVANWWLRVLLVFTIISYSNARSIENESFEYEEDETDLDDLVNYYDQLVEEYTILKDELGSLRAKNDQKAKKLMEEEMKKEIFLQKSKVNLEKEEIKLEKKKIDLEMEKKFVDYDYMSDDPGIMFDETSIIKLPEPNISWAVLSNGTFEDPALAKEQRESGLEEEAIIRSKELRLSAIRHSILEMRSGGAEINNTSSVPSTKALQEMFESKRDFIPNTSTNSYTEKVQSFYPSCDIPKHTDEEQWNEVKSMNLLFDVTYPNPGSGTAISILSAKLRLYKNSQANATAGESATTNSNSTKSDKSVFTQYSGVVSGAPVVDDDRLLRVSVYWYTRTLKKNRVKRKLMDSQMFNTVGGEWMEFNVKTAVRSWKLHAKNYGILVTVEDEDGHLLHPDVYIHSMNCSKDAATVKPLPSILIDATKQYMADHPDANQTQSDGDNATEEVNPFPYPNYSFPTLDVCTVEVPVQEVSNFQNKPNSNTASSVLLARNGSSFFNTVGLGVPSAGQNRNNLVPIITKSDVVTIPEDIRMKNELHKVQEQNDRSEAPRKRHSRKHN